MATDGYKPAAFFLRWFWVICLPPEGEEVWVWDTREKSCLRFGMITRDAIVGRYLNAFWEWLNANLWASDSVFGQVLVLWLFYRSFKFSLLFNQIALKTKPQVNPTKKKAELKKKNPNQTLSFIILFQPAQKGQITLSSGIQSFLCFLQASGVLYLLLLFLYDTNRHKSLIRMCQQLVLISVFCVLYKVLRGTHT